MQISIAGRREVWPNGGEGRDGGGVFSHRSGEAAQIEGGEPSDPVEQFDAVGVAEGGS